MCWRPSPRKPRRARSPPHAAAPRLAEIWSSRSTTSASATARRFHTCHPVARPGLLAAERWRRSHPVAAGGPNLGRWPQSASDRPHRGSTLHCNRRSPETMPAGPSLALDYSTARSRGRSGRRAGLGERPDCRVKRQEPSSPSLACSMSYAGAEKSVGVSERGLMFTQRWIALHECWHARNDGRRRRSLRDLE
jgi:hypothetical protein